MKYIYLITDIMRYKYGRDARTTRKSILQENLYTRKSILQENLIIILRSTQTGYTLPAKFINCLKFTK